VVAARAWPVSSSTLVGRGAEVAALGDVLDGPARLVTLTGPPGVGKTRLAVAAAEAVADRFDELVWVDLAPVRDPERLLDEIAQAAGVPRASALSDRSVLVVLDNCEHLLAAAPAVGELLTTLPRLRVLATSRERLRLRAEHDHPVLPLPMPGPDDLSDLRRLAANPSVALVLERAPAYLTVSPQTAQSLVDICVQLDGLPLALEFAAARLRVFTPGELAFRLEHRMRELTGAALDAPPRHQDLRAAIVWSHDLLPDAERAVFRRLSVFEDGWTLEAAEAVCAGEEGYDVLAALESLLDKSLVRRSAIDDGSSRFSMLLSLREYAAEQLAERGEDGVTRAAHATWFAVVARRLEATLGTDEESRTWERAVAERPDLEAAQAAIGGSGDAEAVLWLAVALGWFWYIRGSPAFARPLLETTAELDPTTSEEVRSAALLATGVVALALGDLERAEGALLGSVALGQGSGDQRRFAIATAFLGHVARERGEHALAVGRYRLVLGIYDEIGHARGTAWAHCDLGLLAAERGDLAEAEAELGTALAMFEELDYSWATAVSACGLADALLASGRVDQAATLLGRALSLHDEVGDRRGTAQALEGLAEVAQLRGAHATAARLLGAAAARRAAVAARPVGSAQDRIDRVTARVGTALGPAGADRERRAGAAVPAPAAVALAARVAASADEAAPDVTLTSRQTEVAALVAAGRTNRQIARELGISEKTAELHVRNTMERLGVHNRAGVAAWVGAHALDAHEP
jgi:predicted ATPase/DNA-binding CsgD family transcriptional regulator